MFAMEQTIRLPFCVASTREMSCRVIRGIVNQSLNQGASLFLIVINESHVASI